MKLSPSDWIAILATIIQVAATVGAAVWQVKKTLPAPIPAEKKPSPLIASNAIVLLRKYWQSWVSITAGAIGLLVLFLSAGPVTKFFVAVSIFLSLMCFFHLIVILAFEFMLRFSDKAIDIFFSAETKWKQRNITRRSTGRA